ncbi:MAG: MgtC/SapB family protein [Gemmatimonadetes bacterium]|uniref:MgtC/SapB family protein n=1 Tax=Candidatus Kutchimonas denitrificans TaxID=3056748 RepID=A0AAE4ZCR2_9BACT|nr:MgtC/SapB family protein [Gemmatimonadota bacterium]NIR76136.1 MgtC/SapB family protein [Candidatus Kutchimonas denitrificans]NIS00515.1 MgtC/SapB family protein [Gemmatimonadota bacterium]NIT66173.1 MgtC/SapB family protein [Gemmatimonadota bacterium]NIU54251.1 methyltransferase [Gemmatimonadota bacterium]
METLELGLLGRLVLATLLGGVIGLERELQSKPAGLRTNILICVGAALLMDISRGVAAAAVVGPADPGRIAAQVVSGIGFIGAGTILVQRGSVVGLTTAATLWVVAAIGLAVGAHFYVPAIGATALVAVTLILLGWVEGFVFTRRRSVDIQVTTEPNAEVLAAIVGIIEGYRLKARTEKVEKQRERFRASYSVRGPAVDRESAFHEVASLPGVRRITMN